MLRLAAAGYLLGLAAAAPVGHEITRLPGWDKPLPSRHYAGYIDAGEDTQDGVHYKMHEHYMFIESENSPKDDPVLLWTNGGPGASSFFGLFVELGPFMLNDASLKTKSFNESGVPSLFYNKYGWSSFSNLLIINSPPPVGFSYCDPVGPSGNGSSCGAWNDTRTAEHNYDFLLNFFEAFPEFKENELYLSGESYAGIYVPTLARKVVRGGKLNLKGFAVGDGVLGRGDFGTGWGYFHVEFMHGHGQFSDVLYEQIVDVCTINALKYNASITDARCQDLLDEADAEVGGFYSYNLYDDCWYENDLLQQQGSLSSRWSKPHLGRTYFGPPVLTGSSASQPRGLARLGAPGDGFKGGLNDYPCGGPHALNVWVAQPTVKKALHVAADAFFFSGDNGAGFAYKGTEPSLFPFYREMQASKMRVLIYNGDTDPGLNSFLGQNWTSHMKFPVQHKWRPWTLDGKQRMGGYVTRYANDFDFLTIRGSGHMVPEFKPAATKAFLGAWLKGKDWGEYVKPKPGSV